MGLLVLDRPVAGAPTLIGSSSPKRILDAFAEAINVPAATIRNWEQGRTNPDPAARALLALVDADPERAFSVLSK